MAYLPSSKPPRASYSATPGWGSMTSRGTVSRPKALPKPSLRVDEPPYRRVSS
jgi:hypothetical protein